MHMYNVLCYIELGWRETYLYCVVWGWGADDLNSMNGYCIMNCEKWSTMYTVYSCMHFLYMCIIYHPHFDRVKCHVRDPSSNSMLLLTLSTRVQSISSFFADAFMSYRENGRTDRQTDGHTRRSHKLFWEHLIRRELNYCMYLLACSTCHLFNKLQCRAAFKIFIVTKKLFRHTLLH